MKSAPVQNPSSLPPLADSCASGSRFIMLTVFFICPIFISAQTDTINKKSQKTSTTSYHVIAQPNLSGQLYELEPYYTLTPEQKRKRQWIVGGINVVGYGASLIIFSKTWYDDQPKTSFHTFDDSKE